LARESREAPIAYLITHFFEGGTATQYETIVAVVHPAGGLPPGQIYHADGPTEGGWQVVSVWDSKGAADKFVAETLVPALTRTSGGPPGPPQERAGEVANLLRRTLTTSPNHRTRLQTESKNEESRDQ
jgi:hypothetical protein